MPDQNMRLHWSPRSPFVRKVVIAANEAGLTGRLQLVRTVVSATAPNPVLLTENPLGKLPTLVLQDGSVLFDSSVIVEHFALLAPSAGLLPPHGPARIAALRHQALGDGLLDLMLLWLDERRRPEEQQSRPLLDAFGLKFRAIVQRLDTEIPSLHARPFDIGHVSIGCGLCYVDFRFPKLCWRKQQAALAAWLEEFEDRPSVRAAPVIDDLGTPVQPL